MLPRPSRSPSSRCTSVLFRNGIHQATMFSWVEEKAGEGFLNHPPVRDPFRQSSDPIIHTGHLEPPVTDPPLTSPSTPLPPSLSIRPSPEDHAADRVLGEVKAVLTDKEGLNEIPRDWISQIREIQTPPDRGSSERELGDPWRAGEITGYVTLSLVLVGALIGLMWFLFRRYVWWRSIPFQEA